MKSFLFCFGYEDKVELNQNSSLGTDHESSTGVFIFAESQDAAMSWGREVAEAFFKHIHEKDDISWKEGNYAYWIERNPAESDWSHCLDYFQKVSTGEFPDLEKLTTEAYVKWNEAQ